MALVSTDNAADDDDDNNDGDDSEATTMRAPLPERPEQPRHECRKQSVAMAYSAVDVHNFRAANTAYSADTTGNSTRRRSNSSLG